MSFDIANEAPGLQSILDRTYRGQLILKDVKAGAYDSNWIKEYELFYSKQPHSKPFVKRLIFKDKKTYMGFVHIRSVSDAHKVSETFLSPPREMRDDKNCFITCGNSYDEYGEPAVFCVPFIMPETIFGMCIHGSIWISLKILERRQGQRVEACDIPKIQNMAMGSPYTDQDGLKFSKASRILRMCNCNSFYINNLENPLGMPIKDSAMIYTLYAYIESGLPVIIGVDTGDLDYLKDLQSSYHSIVAIGHTMADGKVDRFIFHDESNYPYEKLSEQEILKAWHSTGDPEEREAIVAVPPEVTLPFEVLYQQFQRYIRGLEVQGVIDWQATGIQSPRPMLMSFRRFWRRQLIGKYPGLLKFVMSKTLLPSWNWILYFYQSPEQRIKQRDVGYFLRDATMQTDLRLLYLKREKIMVYQKDNRLFKASLDEKGRPRQDEITTLG